jgi:hypothetical protein
MTILLALLLLVLFWGLAYFWLGALFAPSAEGRPAKLEAAAQKLTRALDDLFLPLPAATVKAIILGSIGLGAAIGFTLPGAIKDIERYAIDQAVAANRAGKYEEALDALSRYKDSASPLSHNEQGVANMATGNLEESQKEFLRAVDLAPHYAMARANLAALYGLMGDETKMQFEAARAKQYEHFPISREELYGQTEGIAENLFLRLFAAALLGALCSRLPSLALTVIRRRRAAQFEFQLADALVMAANALRAGLSLQQSLEMVSSKSKPPLSQEFAMVLKEHRLGADLSLALAHMADRMPSPDTRIFVNSVSILRETGGNMTEIFDTLADTIQQRKQVQGKIKTMTAEGEIQAYFLSVLPIVLGFILYQINHEAMTLFFTTFGGWLMLTGMALMEVTGLAMMLRIVRVKV